MSKKQGSDVPKRGRNAAIVPPIGVDFETALGALLKTPPPPTAPKPTRKKSAKKR